MSKRNGDKARADKARMKKLRRRVSMRAARKALEEKGEGAKSARSQRT